MSNRLENQLDDIAIPQSIMFNNSMAQAMETFIQKPQLEKRPRCG